VVPFLLFYKVGITRELQSFIITHANVGMSISDIQTLWLQTMYDAYGSRRQNYITACQRLSKSCSFLFPEFEQTFQRPGEKVIASIIARDYMTKEHLYAKRMCQMTAEKWLSCDHTFKVSANIGFWFNKRWVKLYDTLFIVLNEEGIVLSWKLCKGSKFSSIEDILKLLERRLHNQGKNPSMFFLDNCCSWSSKLRKIFPNISIKLDIFHAVQRVVKKIPRKKGCNKTLKQMRRNMILGFKQVIRNPADIGEQRTMCTPAPEIILMNIEIFLKQWANVEIDSVLLLLSSAIHEIEKLKCHVKKGCLSEIPPSGGTNRNEALHRTLNKSLKRSRIGIELGIAILGLFFYRWNEKKLSKLKSKGKQISYIRPVETYNFMTPGSTMSDNEEHFGGSLNFQESMEAADCEFSDNLKDAKEAVECVSYLLQEHSDSCNSSDGLSSDDQNDNDSEYEDCEPFLNNVGIANAIQQASNLSSLSKHLENIKCQVSVSRSANHLVHLKNVLCLLSSVESTENANNNMRDLDAFLLLNNMERLKIAGNGNCFFVSLATMIQHQLTSDSLHDETKVHLENLGIIIDVATSSIEQMATALRRTVVDEWLSNAADYEPFLLSGQDYQEEANAFLQDGYFAAELGNAMPLAASNALHIPVVVFTTMSNFPIIPICPRDIILTNTPIFLAYDMNFAGHYDAIRQCGTLQQENKEQTESSSSQRENQQITCRCGKGAKRKNKNIISCHEYKSGCKCFQNVVGCSMYCQCVNCSNPRGKKIQGTAQIACSSRKRRHHECSTERLSGKSYTEIKAGGTTTVHWTLFEELVLMQIMLALLASDKLEPEALYREYSHVVDTVTSTSMRRCLGKKTERQVCQKLTTFLSSQQVFETLMKEQIRLNSSE